MDAKVTSYIQRSTKWPKEMAALRPILLGCGLTEAIKWGKPCYSHAGRNIVILQEMKAFLSLMFFKGALLSDPRHALVEQGPNSRSARRMEFTCLSQVRRLGNVVSAYVDEAIGIEEKDVQLGPRPQLDLVAELQERFARAPGLKAAFETLTPGRQREYNLYFAAARKADTRHARVDKCAGKILEGKGLRD